MPLSVTEAVLVTAPAPGVTEEATFTTSEIVPPTGPVVALFPEVPKLHETVSVALVYPHVHAVPDAET